MGRKEGLFFCHPEDLSMSGLMCVCVYTQVFSLFSGVGCGAVLLLLCISLLIIFVLRKDLGTFFRGAFSSPARVALYAFLTLLMAFGASRGYLCYDSDLYHSHAIRWIEEYGVVRGVGNLDGRVAYNSASFSLSALYSFAFLGGQSFHAVAGYMALLVGISALRIFHIVKDKEIRLSDFARIAALYYISDIYVEMLSPASDFFVLLYFYYIVIRALELSEAGAEEEKTAGIGASLALLAFFAVTLKLSAAPLVLVTILPLVYYIREKKYGVIFGCGVSCVLIVLPWLIRNYILSGRLFYPSTALDIFDPVWKVPEGLTRGDSAYIIGYGKGYITSEAADYPMNVWFPHWWGQLGGTEKLFFLASIAGAFFLAAALVIRRKALKEHLVEGTVLATLLFWFFSAPLIRYGRGFLLLFPFLMAGEFVMCVNGGGEKKKSRMVPLCAGLFVLILAYKAFGVVRTVVRELPQPYYICQQDYGEYECEAADVDGITVYVPLDDNRRSCYDFPSTPCLQEGLHALGETAADGFYIRKD